MGWKIKEGMAIMQEKVLHKAGEILEKIEKELEPLCEWVENEEKKVISKINKDVEEIKKEVKKVTKKNSDSEQSKKTDPSV